MKEYLDTLHKQKKKGMHLGMHNNDFDILLRSDHYLAKLQITKIHYNAPKIKYDLYKTSWEYEFSYKLYLAQNVQLCFKDTPHLI